MKNVLVLIFFFFKMLLANMCETEPIWIEFIYALQIKQREPIEPMAIECYFDSICKMKSKIKNGIPFI